MVEQLAVEREAAAVLGECRSVLKVAHVLGQDRLTILDQAEGVLQLAAQGQNRRGRRKPLRQRERRRCIAARSPQHAWLGGQDPSHRVIGAIYDVAVVEQSVIGDPGELPPGLVIGSALRLLGKIAAGQHDRPLNALQ